MNVAIVGASGAVGRELINILDTKPFAFDGVRLFGSRRSAGQTRRICGKDVVIEELTHEPGLFRGIDIAFVSAGAGVSREYAADITAHGTIMIDNSSAFRMDPDVPLVVPEVNPDDAFDAPRRIIANPNCTTIQMVVALEPLRALGHIDRIIVSSYQSSSGAGAKGMEELQVQTGQYLAGEDFEPKAFAHQIAFNCIPHIDVFVDGDYLNDVPEGYTKEEWKMVVETKKIFGDDSVEVAPTCVRVPVLRCHSESINIEFDRPVSVEAVKEALAGGEHVTLEDDPANKVYPMPALHAGSFETFVGRVRRDHTVGDDRGIAMWVVADQLLRGAALNAVYIAQALLPQE